jgi:hypothetical protein
LLIRNPYGPAVETAIGSALIIALQSFLVIKNGLILVLLLSGNGFRQTDPGRNLVRFELKSVAMRAVVTKR